MFDFVIKFTKNKSTRKPLRLFKTLPIQSSEFYTFCGQSKSGEFLEFQANFIGSDIFCNKRFFENKELSILYGGWCFTESGKPVDEAQYFSLRDDHTQYQGQYIIIVINKISSEVTIYRDFQNFCAPVFAYDSYECVISSSIVTLLKNYTPYSEKSLSQIWDAKAIIKRLASHHHCWKNETIVKGIKLLSLKQRIRVTGISDAACLSEWDVSCYRQLIRNYNDIDTYYKDTANYLSMIGEYFVSLTEHTKISLTGGKDSRLLAGILTENLDQLGRITASTLGGIHNPDVVGAKLVANKLGLEHNRLNFVNKLSFPSERTENMRRQFIQSSGLVTGWDKTYSSDSIEKAVYANTRISFGGIEAYKGVFDWSKVSNSFLKQDIYENIQKHFINYSNELTDIYGNNASFVCHILDARPKWTGQRYIWSNRTQFSPAILAIDKIVSLAMTEKADYRNRDGVIYKLLTNFCDGELTKIPFAMQNWNGLPEAPELQSITWGKYSEGKNEFSERTEVILSDIFSKKYILNTRERMPQEIGDMIDWQRLASHDFSKSWNAAKLFNLLYLCDVLSVERVDDFTNSSNEIKYSIPDVIRYFARRISAQLN